MPVNDKASLVRQLVPKSYHFDGYNELNCSNSRDKPFFADNIIPMGEYYLTVRMENKNQIVLEYGTVCPKGEITFKPYKLSLETYVSKLQKAIQDGCDFITFEIFPQYNYDTCSRVCSFKNDDCTAMRKNKPNKVLAAVSFNTSEVKKALAMYFEIINTTKGDSDIMKKKNNMFGFNCEMGLSKDSNIAATLMGVAVRNTENGNWYTFDIANNTRKNLANFKMGNFPIFLLPAVKLEIGDLIKKDGKYYYVKSVNPNNTITLIGAADGVITEMLKEESIIPGMTLYIKVVAFDTKSLMDVGSKENMGGNVIAAMCMMNWANGNNDEFSLDSISDDSFNGLGSCMPMLMAMSGGNFGNMFANAEGGINFPMLMMLGNGDSENDGFTKMLVISQLLGGNTASNPISEMFSPVIAEAPVSEEKVVCEKCNETYPAGTNFCSKCGSATKALATSCKKCGAVLMDGAMFCHKCGAKATADTCPNCGKEIAADENFCSGCGTNLKPEVTPPADETPVVEG